MRKPTANGVTPVYARQHSRNPTLPQLNAIDLLACGKTDSETAGLLNLDRTTVSKWRLYDPVFQAALNRRRAEVWSVGIDRLRSLIPKALDALADAVEDPNHPHRVKAAVELLRLVPLSANALDVGLTDPEHIVERIVAERRSRARGPLDELLEADGKNLSPFDEHMEQVWRELDARLTVPDAVTIPIELSETR
jgi:hypothetical protein